MVKKAVISKQIRNRRARFDYTLGDSIVVGIQLTGAETRSLRLGRGQLTGAYVNINGGELWLVNCTISGAKGTVIPVTEQSKSRKLLAKRREIAALLKAKQQGNTIVPLELLTGGKFIKLRISVGKGKKLYDKRQSIKRREESRRINMANRANG